MQASRPSGGHPRTIYFLCNKLHAGGAEKQLLLTAKAVCELGFTCKIRSFASPEPARSLKPLASEIAAAHGVQPGRFSWKELLGDRQLPQTYWSWGRRADLVLKTCKPLLAGHLFCSLRDADFDKMQRFRAFERFSQGRVDRFVSNSFRACDELAQFVPRVKERSTVVLNALYQYPEAPPAKMPGEIFSVGMLGNILLHKKGYDIALELAALLAARGLPIVINVAGRDESKGAFSAAIHDRKLSHVINYLGPTDRPLEFLSQQDAYLLLSRYEAVPNALLEAMSVGLPCISTKVGDVPILFRDNEHLEMLDALSAEAACQAICRLQADPPRALALGKCARQFVLERCSFARLKTEMERLFSPPPFEGSGLPIRRASSSGLSLPCR